MSEKQHIRYDPLYRVIDIAEDILYVEGKFSPLFDRLKEINNLGIIPEILQMAKYPKYEHHLGTVYQISRFLERVKLKKKYVKPLRLSALFMHVGHLPFTFSTERALLIACSKKNNGSNRIKEHLEQRIRRILKTAGYSKKNQEKVLSDVFSLKNYKTLYRYFSCEAVLDNWSKIRKKFGLFKNQKAIIINNLINPTNDGYGYLEFADQVDYIQRDALYFGTVQLDISPKHLYSSKSIGEKREFFLIDEKELLRNNLVYLRERFYESDDVQWVSRLLEKIVAYLILNRNFNVKWLREFTDSQFKRLITENTKPTKTNAQLPRKWINAQLPKEWIERAKRIFDKETSYRLIFKLKGISFERENNIIDVEHKIMHTNDSFRKLVSYPFETGILLSINYSRKPIYPIHRKYQSFSLAIFQDDLNSKFIELLKVIQHLSKYCSFTQTNEIRKGIGRQISWTNSIRINDNRIIRMISDAIVAVEDDGGLKRGAFLTEFLKDLTSLKTFNSLWHNFENQYLWLGSIRHYVQEHSKDLVQEHIIEEFTKGILLLPIQILQFKTIRKHLLKIYHKILDELILEASDKERGHFFEALFLIEKILERKGDFQFFINNLIVTDPTEEKSKRDVHEFDIIEFIINENTESVCNIYACSTGDNYERENEEQIRTLQKHIHRKYPDIKTFSAYVIPENKKEGNWTPKEISGYSL